MRINLDDVIYQQQMTTYWEDFLLSKIKEHYSRTLSSHAKHLIDN